MHYVPNADIVRLLLERGARIDQKSHSPSGRTPLHCAVIGDRAAVVERLLQHNASAKVRDLWDMTALHYTNDVAIARMILDFDRHVTEIVDCVGNTALLLAATKGNLHLVELLCEYGAALDAVNISDGNTALSSAASKDNLDVVKLLYEYGAAVNVVDTDGNTALLSAASKGNLDIYLYLRDQGASMTSFNHLGNTALHEACAAGREEVVEAMLAGAYKTPQKDAKNREGQTPWSLASFEGHADIVRLLMQAGVTELDPLHLAVIHGQAEVIDVLLDLGLSIDSEDQYGQTVLFRTVERDPPSTVYFLLSR